MTRLSVIIPAYNEGRRIEKTLGILFNYFKEKDYDYEVIVVDDGSTDDTILKAQSSALAKNNKLKIVTNPGNKGKGYAIKNGIMHSHAEYILFTDADMSTPVEELDNMLGYVKQGYDIVIGSRDVEGSRVVLHQPWHREIMGKTFNLIVKAFLLKEFNDTQCGFKLFKGDIAREIAKDMRIDGFAFDVEMLYMARMRNYKVKELGVKWENSPESKVKILHSPISMFFDLFKIKALHHKSGKE